MSFSSSSKSGFGATSRSSQPNAYIAPSNALSNSNTQLNATPSPNPILSNRLIPRDYLTSLSKPSSHPSITKSHGPIGSAETGISRPELFQSNSSVIESRGSEQDTSGVRTQNSVIHHGGSVSERHRIDVGQHLKPERVDSPESVATTVSIDNPTTTSRPDTGLSSRSIIRNMPRTSSIDSAISSISVSSSQRRDHGDARDPSPSSIRNLIATAGSAENLVLHLLKEKSHAASQNSQLWTLVEKQRALLLGLNKDLERVTKDRDKYKKKLKELQSNRALPRLAPQSPSLDASNSYSSDAVKPPDSQHFDDSLHHSTADSASNDTSSPIEAPGPAIILVEDSSQVSLPPPPDLIQHNSQAQTAGLTQPTFSLTEPAPLADKPSKGFSSSRKIVPKPLNLLQNGHMAVQQQDPTNAGNEEEPRGRRKTREEDDRDREKSLKQEKEARSKSKKEAAAQGTSEGQKNTAPAINLPLQEGERAQGVTTHTALNVPSAAYVQERLIPMPLKSPGLPMSPRPINNMSAYASLPMSPRAPPPGPLTPRAPKQPIPPPMMSPSPFADPAMIQRQNAMARSAAQQSYQAQDRLQTHEPSTSNEIPSVYLGLVSTQYPNLLLPPNALPSIEIRVASSRLRPARHSMLSLRTQEDSTVFSLSVFSRASRNELWRIEKIPAALPQLDQQMRPRCKDLPKLPDKKLFNGHSPAIIDARRQAVDTYFEELLDMEIDEPSALMICRFLSTDVLDPASEGPSHFSVNHEPLPRGPNSASKVVKTGFLTKRGKNFGGWKSRYFILDGPDLRYFETPGGSHLGTIKITHSKIGTQKIIDPAGADPDDQYRHSFLIQEPKKKDSTTYIRHVLCAENDVDRDQWVAALLHYVETDTQKENDNPPSAIASSANKFPALIVKEKHANSPSNTPSPTSPVSLTDTGIDETMSRGPNISGPMNGALIQDSTQWGNKTNQSLSKEKGSKMGSIFHFKKTSQEQLSQFGKPQEATPKPRVLRHNGYVRPVFGLPLAEAVEFCKPFNVDVQIPAVVYRCIEYMRFRNAANEEGLFRLSGSNIVVKTLKERFNNEGDVDLVDEDEPCDVHAVASLFKTYLRELPSPLLTRELHIEFLRVLELESQAEKIPTFNILVHRLPSVNFHLLRTISQYLLEVTENASKNKMSIRNMGIVFSPTVNIPTPVFNMFLNEFEAIFERQPHEEAAQHSPVQRTDLRVPTGLSPGDIRSPRRQMFSDIPTPAYNQTNFNHEDKLSQNNSRGHQNAGSNEFGFTPLHPSYENGSYVTRPQAAGLSQHPAPNTEQYGSLNQILVPENASTDKRRKRESAMLL